MNDRRSLTLGVVLLLLGMFFLLRHTVGFSFSGPGPILLLIGAIFLVLSALRSFRGPLLPGGVLLGLGAGFLLQGILEPHVPRWATLVLGLGSGFLLVAALDAAAGRERRPTPLVPGLILISIAAVAALSRRIDLSEFFDRLAGLWPWALIAAGVVLVVTSLMKRRA